MHPASLFSLLTAPYGQTFRCLNTGAFRPSPTGPLHFGSLVAAVGSYLDARHHQGKWLVRIEDLDTPRTVDGAAADILGTLEAHGLHWDEQVVYQSRRTAAYEQAFLRLKETGMIYPCACSRREIADSALQRGDELVYPGTCRNGIAAGKAARSWRVRVNDAVITLDDLMQGIITQDLASEVGDFVLLRADGLYAYQLAVVVDDAAQEITDVVRGADLLFSTPRQVYLQRLLGLTTPCLYAPAGRGKCTGRKAQQADPRRTGDKTQPGFHPVQCAGVPAPESTRRIAVRHD